MDQQGLLARAPRGTLLVEHFQIVDPVERRIAEDRGLAVLVAATVDHELPP